MAITTKKTTSASRAGKTGVRKPSRSNLTPPVPFGTKTDYVITMLRRKDGASLAEIMEAIGWKEHSVRALLTATIAKGRELPLIKSRSPGEPTRYHIAAIRPTKVSWRPAAACPSRSCPRGSTWTGSTRSLPASGPRPGPASASRPSRWWSRR